MINQNYIDNLIFTCITHSNFGLYKNNETLTNINLYTDGYIMLEYSQINVNTQQYTNISSDNRSIISIDQSLIQSTTFSKIKMTCNFSDYDSPLIIETIPQYDIIGDTQSIITIKNVDCLFDIQQLTVSSAIQSTFLSTILSTSVDGFNSYIAAFETAYENKHDDFINSLISSMSTKLAASNSINNTINNSL